MSEEQSQKIDAVLKAMQTKPTIDRDLSIYVMEDGTEVSTKDRINKNVRPVVGYKPTDEQLFKNGKPDLKFLKDHLYHEGRLNDDQVIKILKDASELLKKEPNLLRVPAPVTVCGDIHGQYYDLIKLLQVGGDPENTRYLFLGDYVDRGSFSIECVLYLYSLKINYPDSFFLLRGNHECKHLTDYFTFKMECLHKYNSNIYKAMCDSFNTLPLAALMNDQYFCCHGGISPDLQTPEDLNKINRFREPPTRGLMCDILWADPVENYDEEVTDNAPFIPNSIRGCSYAYTFRAVLKFLQRNNLLSVIRAHEAQDAGYRMYKRSPETGFPTLLTIFSAPNYLDTYKNKAAVLKYGNNSMNIRQFAHEKHPYYLPNFMDVFTWSLPFVGEKVTDILVSVLNICTEEELDEHVPLNENILQNISELNEKLKEDKEIDENELDEIALKKRKLRNKILAIGRVSRMFQILREESEDIQRLKNLSGGFIPRGTLLSGSDGIKESISNFEEAKRADLVNEAVPPSQDELNRIEEQRELQIINDIDEHVNQDKSLQSLARRYSSGLK